METIGRRRLGSSDLTLPQLGIGTDSWGEALLGYGKHYGEEDLYAVYRACLDRGLDLFDTAPGYGRGESEAMLGRFRRRDGRPIIVATKYDNPTIFSPSITRGTANTMLKEIESSLARLRAERIDLYQIHFPVPERRVDEYAEVLGRLVREGKARTVGVSNFNAPLLRKMHDRLARVGVPFVSNQIGYSILNRSCETNGVLAACRELDITLIAFTPLAVGLLSGKYRSGSHTLGRFQKTFFRLGQLDPFHQWDADRPALLKRVLSRPRALCDLEPLFGAMEQVAANHKGSLVQVALNWLRRSDPLVLPIPGAKNLRQLEENVMTLEWTMTGAEWREISRVEIESR